MNENEEGKVNRFDVELDVTEATFLMEAIKYALSDTVIDADRKASLEGTLKKINDGFDKTLLMF